MRNSRYVLTGSMIADFNPIVGLHFRAFVTPVVLALTIAVCPDGWAQDTTTSTPTFGDHVLPILRKNCVACHHSKLAEGGLNLESIEAINAGGDSGAIVSAEQPETSLLLGRANGTVDDIMPPEDNGVGAEQLTAEELAIILQWIQGGMPAGNVVPMVSSDSWQNLPQSLRSIYSVASSPDGHLVAVGRGNTLHLLDSKTGILLQDLVDDGLASIGAAAETVQTPRAHLDFVNALAFDPQGRWLASGGFRTVKLWRRSGNPAMTHDSYSQADEATRQSLFTELIKSLNRSTPAGLELTEPANLLEGIDLAGQSVVKLFAAPGTSHAVATLSDGQTRLIDLATKKLGPALPVSPALELRIARAGRDANRQKQHAEFVAGLIPGLEEALKKEDEALAKVQKTKDEAVTALETKKTELANAEAELKAAQEATEPPTEQAKIDELTKKRDEIQKGVPGVEAALVAAEQALAAATDARAQSLASLEKVRLEAEGEKVRQSELEQAANATLEGRATTSLVAAGILPHTDGKGIVAVAASTGHVSLYSYPEGLPMGTLNGGPANPSRLVFLDHQWLLSLSMPEGDATAAPQWSVWSVPTTWQLDQTIGSPIEASPLSDRITALDFSPDGRWLVVGSGQPSRIGEIYVIDLESMQIHATWDRLHSDTVLALKISPDGRRLASAGADRQIRVVDFPSGENPRSLEGHTHHVLGLAWHDNSRRLASVSADHTVKVWDTRNVQAERTINAGNKELAAVTFMGTTPQIAVCSGGGAVWLYNTDNGSQVRAYQGVSGFQMALTADGNGQWLAAGGDTGSLRVWPIESPQPSVTWPTNP